jgi:cytochrome P450
MFVDAGAEGLQQRGEGGRRGEAGARLLLFVAPARSHTRAVPLPPFPPNSQTHNNKQQNNSACCVYALSTNPAAQRRLAAEVDAFFAERGRGAALTPEAVAGCFPFAEGAVKEALRLYTPVTATVREVSAPPDDPHAYRSDLLALPAGGAGAASAGPAPPALRPGLAIAAANYAYQRSPDYWPRPEEFLPERWVPEERGGAASVLGATTPSAWTPFGAGPRQCVGIKFAMLEAVIALARLLERFDFAPAPGQRHPLPMKQALTLSPDGGVSVVVRRRPEYAAGAAAKAA